MQIFQQNTSRVEIVGSLIFTVGKHYLISSQAIKTLPIFLPSSRKAQVLGCLTLFTQTKVVVTFGSERSKKTRLSCYLIVANANLQSIYGGTVLNVFTCIIQSSLDWAGSLILVKQMRLRILGIRPYCNLRSFTKSGLYSGTLTFYLINSQKSRLAHNNIIHTSGSEPVTDQQVQLSCGGECCQGRCCPAAHVVLKQRDKYVKPFVCHDCLISLCFFTHSNL